jgi:alkylation response protein AidB-like acyl-CoA dehydrogenase
VAGGALASLAITGRWAAPIDLKTRFTPDGDNIIVDGGKLFITSGDVADLLLVFGKWSAIEDRNRRSALIIEKGVPGFQSCGPKKLGHRASTTAELAFNDCRVRAPTFLGNQVRDLPYCWPRSTNRGRALRHTRRDCHRRFKDMVAYMNSRVVANRHVIDFQANQFLIADLAAELAMTEAWLDYVASLIDGGAAVSDWRPQLPSCEPVI